jgi:geranylgeranyl diphosphate synthase type II
MELTKYMYEIKALVDEKLNELLSPESEHSSQIYKAMNYSVFAGGKRLRPILTIATAESLGCDRKKVLPAACAIEMIHTYSLIHDDLPAMDNDDFRRGKPTNHKVYGEAMAILAGDALLNLAFEVFLDKSNLIQIFGETKVLKAMTEMAFASGIRGMVGGQVVDILYEGKNIDEDLLKYMHSHKTGALLTASVKIGAILAGASQKQLEVLTGYAEKIGLMYQIIDDILDVTGDETKLGKPTGSDLKHKKNTYITIYGLDKSRMLAKSIANQARDLLKSYEGDTEFFNNFTDYLGSRQS